MSVAGSLTLTGPYAADGGKALDDNGPYTAIATHSGRAFDLAAPDTWADSIWLDDIAQSLSCITRYGGHTQFYSVAEHALRVSGWLFQNGYDDATQMLGLHRDDTEAYVGDIPRPQKKLMTIDGVPFDEYEHTLAEHHLFPALGVEYSDEMWAAVKKADFAVYEMERSERPTPAMEHKRAMVPGVAKEYWLLRHERLVQDLNG